MSDLQAFRILLRDYERLLESVHPVRGHENVFSHRLFELLLRACTEFESLAKSLHPSTPNGNINDLSLLHDEYDLGDVAVCCTLWRPDERVSRPLRGWTESPHKLTWYRSYNKVKHNRETAFEHATLGHVTDALAATFELLVACNSIPTSIENHIHLDDNRMRFWYPDFPQFLAEANERWAPFGIEFADD